MVGFVKELASHLILWSITSPLLNEANGVDTRKKSSEIPLLTKIKFFFSSYSNGFSNKIISLTGDLWPSISYSQLPVWRFHNLILQSLPPVKIKF